MTKNRLLIIIFSVFNTLVFGQKNNDLNINHKLPGNIYVKSSIIDTSSIGGFGSSNNKAKKLTDSLLFNEQGLFIKIDTSKIYFINGKFNTYKLFIGNKSDTIVKLDAEDSRLNVISEVFLENKWNEIEYLTNSFCGNSSHKVYLNKNEYWSFDIPKFNGNIKTRLRYKLMLTNQTYIYSNEILTSINKNQFAETKPLKNKRQFEW